MILTLCGMSGVGKSYWSKKLESAGFIRFGCDDLITTRIANDLGFASTVQFDMHQWVGYPDEVTHKERAEKYLQAEENVLKDIFDYLSNTQKGQNIVVDSTGSVIYMPESILKRLQQLTKIVYLDITQQDHEKMLRYYLRNPVAIIWNGFFQPRPGESRLQIFSRCYPLLIKSREEKYRELAHLTVPAETHKASNTTLEDMLEFVNSY